MDELRDNASFFFLAVDQRLDYLSICSVKLALPVGEANFDLFD